MEYKKWKIASDIYDSTPYECPFCGARVEIQKTICPNCNQPVLINDFKDERLEYERIIETLVKLP